ncbi:MAG: capsule assembly Wzi family protein [Chitinophagaceae bacterium]|nr:capsule assembly Wzi family protein [Chitinophagaceae bacterium]
MLFIVLKGFSQSVPIGQIGTDDMLRVLQLTGKMDESNSFTARPFFYHKGIERKNLLNLIDSSNGFELAEHSLSKGKIQFAILPTGFTTKYNSHHPYGWNDQGMIMAKGIQTSLTAGAYAKIGPLSIQLQPEFVYAANNAYDITQGYGSNSGKSFSKFFPGQSSIRLNLGAVSIAASTENLWWGPGQFSSLLMSNNAPGFQHLSFHTNRPLKTPIGSFEWQLVVGKFDEDTTAANENNFMKPLNPRNESRYFNGIVLTYQPKWMEGFFLGLTRMDHLYSSDQQRTKGSFIQKYLPVLAWASSDSNALASSIPNDGAISLFTRWILPKHKIEFYLEYGYNDFKANFRDFSSNPNHSSAFIAGFKKIIELKNNQLLDISGEITHMAQTTSYIVRNSGNWYEHGQVTQGLTYQNQIVGAGSGKGNNVQTIQVKKIKGFDYLGIKFQRIQQDPKALVGSQNLIGMRENQWNDLSLGLLAQKRWNKFLLNGETQFVRSHNYGWEKGNVFNVYALVNCIYFF